MHSNRASVGCTATCLRKPQFETKERAQESLWHNRIDRREPVLTPALNERYRGSARIGSWNPTDANMTLHPLNRSLSVPKNVHVPYNFDAIDQTLDAVHTAPYFNTQLRKELIPTESAPHFFHRIEGRIHQQGRMKPDMHPTWHTAIPGYTGHQRGKAAENVYGGRYCLENEKAQVKVLNRRPEDTAEYGQTTIKGLDDPPRLWKETAKQRWKRCTHGMTHQPGEPFGHGDTYRRNLAEKEHAERTAAKADYDHATTTVKTWAANQPQNVRDHNSWRTGICGYTGHSPVWKKEKEFFEKRELGKVHPPYCPKVQAYSCFVQPPETPTPQRH